MNDKTAVRMRADLAMRCAGRVAALNEQLNTDPLTPELQTLQDELNESAVGTGELYALRLMSSKPTGWTAASTRRGPTMRMRVIRHEPWITNTALSLATGRLGTFFSDTCLGMRYR